MAYIKNYTKQEWVNLPEETTPLSAERLTHMENGIDTLDNRIVEMSGRYDTNTISVGRKEGEFPEPCSIAFGENNSALHRGVAIGNNNTVKQKGLAVGSENQAGVSAILLGEKNKTEGEIPGGVAIGHQNTVKGAYAQAFGYENTATGVYSHAEGKGTAALGDSSHAEGNNTESGGYCSHAEGNTTKATGDYSHAEGKGTAALGSRSHAEGDTTKASGQSSHAEGYGTIASGDSSHAEGKNTQAIGYFAHAEGCLTESGGDYSHAEGYQTEALGARSHAEGLGTNAAGSQQHVQGSYNLIDETGTFLHIIGNGGSESTRSNAHTVDRAGNAWYAGDVMNGAGVSLTALKSAVEALGQFHAAIVEVLPTADIQTNTIYMIRKVPAGEAGDIYDEYLNLDGTADGWEYLGSTGIDLTEYAKKTELSTKTSQLTNDSGLLTETDKAELLAYVDAKFAELAGTT